MQKVNIVQLKKKFTEYLQSRKVSEEISESCFRHMLFAEESGRSAHGFSRFSRLDDLIKAFSPFPDISVAAESSNSVVFNCGHTPGYFAGSKAAEKLIELLKTNAIATVGGNNTDSLGVMGYYMKLITDAGYIGLGFSSSVARIAPWGSSQPIAGTSPMTIGIPRKPHDLIYDAATSKITVGDVLTALKQGSSLPAGTLLDENGKPSTNPDDFKRGSLAAEAGHKGAGLAFMLDLLSGALVGAPGSSGGGLGKFDFLFIGIAPHLLFPGSEWEARVSGISELAEKSAVAFGLQRVTLPGQRSSEKRMNAGGTVNINEDLCALLGISS